MISSPEFIGTNLAANRSFFAACVSVALENQSVVKNKSPLAAEWRRSTRVRSAASRFQHFKSNPYILAVL